MKDIANIDEVLLIDKLENEYDLHKASLLERKLRLLEKENSKYIGIRKKLRLLISDYESINWSDADKITHSQIVENDKAENIVAIEQQFVFRRKDTIITKLKEFDMNQQELGILLGHPKSYMSELINGVSQFSMKDLVVIHRLLGIPLDLLIPTFLQSATRLKINESISKLNKPKLKLRKLELAV